MQPTSHQQTYWPPSHELDDPAGPSTSDSFQESYFEKLIRARSSIPAPKPEASYTPQPPRAMSASTASPAMAYHPWNAAWTSNCSVQVPVHHSAAPASIASASSSRFDQLLKAKLAAEKVSAPVSTPAFPVPAGFDAALAKLQTEDTVVNRSFIAPQYNTPQHVMQKPAGPSSPVRPMQTANQPMQSFVFPSASPRPSQPASLPRSPQQPEMNVMPNAFAGFDQSSLGSEQLSASLKSMVTQRITDMYASSQPQPSPMPARVQPPSLQIPESSMYSAHPGSPNLSLTSSYQPFSPNYTMGPSPTVPQAPRAPATPSFQFETWNEGQAEPLVKVEPDWSAGAVNSAPYQPFMLSVTPPQNGVPISINTAVTPSYHSHSDSIDSIMSVSPITPQLTPYPPAQYGTPIDIKPIISPALSTATLPGEDPLYPRYNPNAYGLPTRARFVGASTGDGQNGSSSDLPYDMGNGDGSDAGNLNGLDFSSLGGGGGGGSGDDGEDGNHNGDDQNGGGEGPPPPSGSRGRKLPLACHFCRRRKLKCDGQKPTCDNCAKRSIECTYDDHVRRRGPGKRTKEMRERSAREAEEGGVMPSIDLSSLQQHDFTDEQLEGIEPVEPLEIPENDQFLSEAHLQASDLEHAVHHADLLLDPALANETGDAHQSADVMEAMGALKQAGIELGLHHEEHELGEPSTLAELTGLEGLSEEIQAAQDQAAAANHMGMKRKSEVADLEFTEEDAKRLRLEASAHLDDPNGHQLSFVDDENGNGLLHQ